MKKHAWWRWGLAVVLVIAACVALVPRPKLLLATAQEMPFAVKPLGIDPDVWCSDHEQYVFKPMDAEAQVGAHRPNADCFGVFIQNLNTGEVTPQQSFNESFDKSLNKSFDGTMVSRLPRSLHIRDLSSSSTYCLIGVHVFSPDHQWLLWNNATSTKEVGRIMHAYALDGKQERHWKILQAKASLTCVCWLADSRRWVELIEDKTNYLRGVTIHSLDVPDTAVTKMFVNRGSHWLLGITPDAHLLSYDPMDAYIFRALVYYDTPLDDAAPISRKITIPLPPDMYLEQVFLSPDGTRLLWHLTPRTRLPGLPLIREFLARLGIHPEQQEALWVSSKDGSGLHEIGQVAVKPLQPTLGRHMTMKELQATSGKLYDIQWLPGGKRILFEHGNDVYTAPVD